MFVYQNGKLYVEDKKNLVGVEIHSDGVILTNDTAKYTDGMILTPHEVRCKFNIASLELKQQVVETEPPKTTDKKEEVKDAKPTRETQTPPRGRGRK